MTQLKTIALNSTKTIPVAIKQENIDNIWKPKTKEAAIIFIKNMDSMFNQFGSILTNAFSLANSILNKNENFGSAHLKQLTCQTSWLDVDLDQFKSIIRQIMKDEYQTDYYDHVSKNGRKNMKDTFKNKSRRIQFLIYLAKKLYIPSSATPLECCYPKQHGRLVFSALILLSWVSNSNEEFKTNKKRLLTAVNPNSPPENFTTYYQSVDIEKRHQPRLYLNIEELDNIVTEWAKN